MYFNSDGVEFQLALPIIEFKGMGFAYKASRRSLSVGIYINVKFLVCGYIYKLSNFFV